MVLSCIMHLYQSYYGWLNVIPLFQSSIGRSVLLKETFTKHREVTFENVSYTLHQLNGEIWCCSDIITIYNTQLEKLRQIDLSNIGKIRSLAHIRGRIAVATSGGLLIIDCAGLFIQFYVKIYHINIDLMCNLSLLAYW